MPSVLGTLTKLIQISRIFTEQKLMFSNISVTVSNIEIIIYLLSDSLIRLEQQRIDRKKAASLRNRKSLKTRVYWHLAG